MPSDLSFWDGICASSLSGIVARLLFHPLDTVKARFQATEGKTSYIKTVQDTWKMGRHRAFYGGLGVSLAGAAPALTLFVGSFEHSLPIFQAAGMQEDFANFAAGFFAETVSCVLWVPLDVLKERLQTGIGGYAGPVDAIRTVMATEGLRGLYRGYLSTLASFGPYSALYFLFYRQAKLQLTTPSADGSGDLSVPRRMAASALSAAAAAVLTSPLDFIKLRLQLQRRQAALAAGGETPYHYRGLTHGLSTIWHEVGATGLWRGALLRAVFMAPNTAFSIALYEVFRDHLAARSK